ncbi:MAG: hypothetical protein ACYTGH_13325 [Planctomycetota bacterium]|jgi:hypothetical protein
MIEINLLPENLRRSESTPLAQQLAIYIGVAAWAGLIFLNVSYYNQTTQAEKILKDKKVEITNKKKAEKELKEVKGKIAGIKTHVNAVEALYRNRLVWAKVLSDLKQIMHKQGYKRINTEGEYLWFNDLQVKAMRKVGAAKTAGGPTHEVIITGYASAKATRRATLMIERLMAEMKDFKPDLDQKDRLSEELKKKIIENKKSQDEQEKKGQAKAKAGSPLDAQLKAREEKADQKLLEHLELDSGGVAVQSFWELFQGLTYKQSWEEELSLGDAAKALQKVPLSGMKFELHLGIKPPPKPEKKSRFKRR